jgi:ribonucleoside-diphosphate reductase beta chain
MSKIFFDGPIAISRFDKVKYPWMRKLTQKQKGFFWQPEEVELSRDSKDFKTLNDPEKHIFTSNLKRQILLDSVQGSAPSEALGPIASLPELRSFLKIWEDFEENIHAWSYQYILENLYPDAGIVYDTVDTIPEIQSCRKDISKYYNDLSTWNDHRKTAFNNPQGSITNLMYDEYKHKKSLWLCLHAINALEGVRFYVSFACSWAFAELKKMEGNAKIIKFIARDENLHLAFTQQLIRALPKSDSDFIKIAEECKTEVEQLFKDVANQENDWAKYLFKYGSMLGLYAELLAGFVDHRAYKCATALGVHYEPKCKDNNLPWTSKWIGGAEVQVAPQETQQTQYTIGGILNDVSTGTFKGFTL